MTGPGMNPFDTLETLGRMLGQGAETLVQMQGTLARQWMGLAASPGAWPGLGAEGFQGAASAFQRSLASALDLSQTLVQRLQADDAADPATVDLLAKALDPRAWLHGMSEMDGFLARVAEGPQLADLWTVERRFAGLALAWAAAGRRSLEHNTVMLEAWTRALGAFAAALDRRAEEGRALESWREVTALWIETANDVLLDAQRSEPFLASQRALLKASTDLQRAQQEVATFLGDLLGLPTRTEVDDLHRTVTELRRELRALQRERRAERSRSEAPPPGGPEQAENSHG